MGLILLHAFFNMSASDDFSHLCCSVPLNAIGVMKVVLDIFVVIEDTCGTCVYLELLALKPIGQNQVATRPKSRKSSYK